MLLCSMFLMVQRLVQLRHLLLSQFQLLLLSQFQLLLLSQFQLLLLSQFQLLLEPQLPNQLLLDSLLRRFTQPFYQVWP